jgi:hypothetical protein
LSDALPERDLGKHGVKPMGDDDFHKLDDPEFHKDLLIGAEAISTWLLGTPEKARSIFHLAETSQFPLGRLGSRIVARKHVAVHISGRKNERPSTIKRRKISFSLVCCF